MIRLLVPHHIRQSPHSNVRALLFLGYAYASPNHLSTANTHLTRPSSREAPSCFCTKGVSDIGSGQLPAFPAQADHLHSHANNKHQCDATLRANQHGRLQVSNKGMPIGHSAQCLGNGGHHQEKRRQAQEKGFQVQPRTSQPGHVPYSVTSCQQGKRDDANDVADRLLRDQKHAEGADQHRRKVELARCRAGDDAAVANEHIGGQRNGGQAAEGMDPAEGGDAEH